MLTARETNATNIGASYKSARFIFSYCCVCVLDPRPHREILRLTVLRGHKGPSFFARPSPPPSTSTPMSIALVSGERAHGFIVFGYSYRTGAGV